MAAVLWGSETEMVRRHPAPSGCRCLARCCGSGSSIATRLEPSSDSQTHMHTRNANSQHQLCEEFTTFASTSKKQRRSKHITNCAHTHTRTCTACSDRRGLMFPSQGSLNASVAQRQKIKTTQEGKIMKLQQNHVDMSTVLTQLS